MFENVMKENATIQENKAEQENMFIERAGRLVN